MRENICPSRRPTAETVHTLWELEFLLSIVLKKKSKRGGGEKKKERRQWRREQSEQNEQRSEKSEQNERRGAGGRRRVGAGARRPSTRLLGRGGAGRPGGGGGRGAPTTRALPGALVGAPGGGRRPAVLRRRARVSYRTRRSATRRSLRRGDAPAAALLQLLPPGFVPDSSEPGLGRGSPRPGSLGGRRLSLQLFGIARLSRLWFRPLTD